MLPAIALGNPTGLAIITSLLAAIVANAAVLVHDYELAAVNYNAISHSYADSINALNPALFADGGTAGSTSYTFDPNQGLNLSNGGFTNDYSILVDFSFHDLSGFRKIIDFKNQASDNGVYNLSTALNYFNFATGPTGTFTPDQLARLVLTRDGTTGVVTGYVNGVQQLQFTDSTSDAVFNAANNIARFFEDDNVTGGRESSGGSAARIEIWTGALSTAEVAVLGGPTETPSVPEPTTLVIWGFSALGCAVAGYRRRKTT